MGSLSSWRRIFTSELQAANLPPLPPPPRPSAELLFEDPRNTELRELVGLSDLTETLQTAAIGIPRSDLSRTLGAGQLRIGSSPECGASCQPYDHPASGNGGRWTASIRSFRMRPTANRGTRGSSLEAIAFRACRFRPNPWFVNT